MPGFQSFAEQAHARWGGKGDDQADTFGGSSSSKGGKCAKGFGGSKGFGGGKGFGKGFGGKDRGFGGKDSYYGGNNGGLGANLHEISWTTEELVPVQKNFYAEHPNVTNMCEQALQAWKREHSIAVHTRGESAPRPVMTFEEAQFPTYVMQSILRAGFDKPSPIQCQAWPIALSGRDMIGIAETGSGKTLAFLLPAIVHICAQTPLRYGDGPICLVLAPTRELAMQIETECNKFCLSSRLRTTCLYGGVPKGPQIRALKQGAEIVVATPGRLIDLLDIGITNLKRVTYLCLDEADRMLDMGFEDQVRTICGQIRPDRQTLFFSATWPSTIQHLAQDLCQSEMPPMHITIGSQALKANKNITQHVEILYESGFALEQRKQEMLEAILGQMGSQKLMIFSQTKRGCDALAKSIRWNRHNADSIHGDKKQEDRDWVLQKFRDGLINILVATDVAARGLDVKDVTCVINFDMPGNIEDYVHRIGRTGRAGATGEAVSFFSVAENGKMARDLISVLKSANQQVPQELYSCGGSGGYGRKGGKGKGGNRFGKGAGKGGNRGFGNNGGFNNGASFRVNQGAGNGAW